MNSKFIDGKVSDLGSMDIYLIDQIQKKRITRDSKILDAGFGKGRNLEYFVKNNIDIHGIEQNKDLIPIVIEKIKNWNSSYPTNKFISCSVEKMPYLDNEFDFIASVAVLHFAKSHQHFWDMLLEMLRVLKNGGILLFRMTSWHTFTLNNKTNDGLVNISDGTRYMLDIDEFKDFVIKNNLELLDPLKTVNVDEHRTMTTIVLKKTN